MWNGPETSIWDVRNAQGSAYFFEECVLAISRSQLRAHQREKSKRSSAQIIIWTRSLSLVAVELLDSFEYFSAHWGPPKSICSQNASSVFFAVSKVVVTDLEDRTFFGPMRYHFNAVLTSFKKSLVSHYKSLALRLASRRSLISKWLVETLLK